MHIIAVVKAFIKIKMVKIIRSKRNDGNLVTTFRKVPINLSDPRLATHALLLKGWHKAKGLDFHATTAMHKIGRTSNRRQAIPDQGKVAPLGCNSRANLVRGMINLPPKQAVAVLGKKAISLYQVKLE